MKRRGILVLVTLVILALTLAAVWILQPRPNSREALPFVTIELNDIAIGVPLNPSNGYLYQPYTEERPSLVVISELGDLQKLNNNISFAAYQQLQSVDYNNDFALVVFQGYQFTTGYGAQIQQVVLHNNNIDVVANFQVPTPGMQMADIASSPYHVVKVNGQQLQGEYVINLIINGQPVATQLHSWP